MNYELFKSIHNLSGHSNVLDNIMVFITNNAIYIFALTLLVLWVFGGKSMKRAVLYAGGTGVVALVVNVLISLIYFEPRPFVTHHIETLIPHAADASFPSDHSTGAFAIAIAMWFRYKKVGIPMFILALLTGYSRIWAGVHYPFDVLGSLIVAIVVSYVIVKLSRWFDPLVNWIISIYESIIGKRNRANKSS
ncbi:undecaprenyl-diphosphatase [Bacillus sp. FJAT-29790]|uniref:undecaprenyl-diphosphatase n=1 Tax=Bacillus sp. FJAT-29790 TaxID=1895002 RepID=UPI001C24FF2D|nr:undecaprenyl-diphosphatase [Bacillus sp. FJAT-29790]MBU8878681.1 undecaprenyl-diphosphatase [Bacillus sp. FJAT-29790]